MLKRTGYLHANGTSKLRDLSYFPCQCPTCLSYTVKELLDLDKEKRTAEVANHNLYMLQAEVSKVKQTIVDGRLWEYSYAEGPCASESDGDPRAFEEL